MGTKLPHGMLGAAQNASTALALRRMRHALQDLDRIRYQLASDISNSK